jgi:probable rRNA maturation factor
MEKGIINFFNEEITFTLNKKKQLTEWIQHVIADRNCTPGDINFIFCSDEYLRNMNKQYLNHDYFTDVITFSNTIENIIGGDIFISIDRIKINSKEYKTEFDDELHRVMIHGILHLLGEEDQNEKEKLEMRGKENFWLSKFPA